MDKDFIDKKLKAYKDLNPKLLYLLIRGTYAYNLKSKRSWDDVFIPLNDNLLDIEELPENKAFNWQNESVESYVKVIISYKYYPFLNKEQTLKDIENLNFFNLKNNDFFIKDTNNKEIFPSHLWLNLIKYSVKKISKIRLNNNDDFLDIIYNKFYKDSYKYLSKFVNHNFNKTEIDECRAILNDLKNLLVSNLDVIENRIKEVLAFYKKTIETKKAYMHLRKIKQDAYVSYQTKTLTNYWHQSSSVYFASYKDPLHFTKHEFNESHFLSLKEFEQITNNLLNLWDCLKNSLEDFNLKEFKNFAIYQDSWSELSQDQKDELSKLITLNYEEKKQVNLKDDVWKISSNPFHLLFDFYIQWNILRDGFDSVFNDIATSLTATKRMYKFRQTIVLKTFNNFKEYGLKLIQEGNWKEFSNVLNDSKNDWRTFYSSMWNNVPSLVFFNKHNFKTLLKSVQLDFLDQEVDKDYFDRLGNWIYLKQKDLIDKKDDEITLEDKLNSLPLYNTISDLFTKNLKNSAFYYENIDNQLKKKVGSLTDNQLSNLEQLPNFIKMANDKNVYDYIVDCNILQSFNRNDYIFAYNFKPYEIDYTQPLITYSVNNENKAKVQETFLNWCNYIEEGLKGVVLYSKSRLQMNEYSSDGIKMADLNLFKELFDASLEHNEEVILSKFTYKANNSYENEINALSYDASSNTKIRR